MPASIVSAVAVVVISVCVAVPFDGRAGTYLLEYPDVMLVCFLGAWPFTFAMHEMRSSAIAS